MTRQSQSTTAVPRLAFDVRRLTIATIAGVAADLLASAATVALMIARDLPRDRELIVMVGVLTLAVVMFGSYQVMTWHAFAPLDGERLREVARATGTYTAAERWRDLLLGNGPKSWSVTAAVIAMVAVGAVILKPDLRASPAVIVLAPLSVVLSWTLISFAFAVSYLRLHSADPTAIQFGNRTDGGLPVWRDYVYLAFQVSTTFSSSDVSLETTRARGQVTAHSILAFVFNTVIIALLVSALTSL